MADARADLVPQIIAYAKALALSELFDAALSEGTANLSRRRDREAGEQLWSELTRTRAELAKMLGVPETDLPTGVE